MAVRSGLLRVTLSLGGNNFCRGAQGDFKEMSGCVRVTLNKSEKLEVHLGLLRVTLTPGLYN